MRETADLQWDSLDEVSGSTKYLSKSVREIEGTLKAWRLPLSEVQRTRRQRSKHSPSRSDGVFVIEGVLDLNVDTNDGGCSILPIMEYARSVQRTCFRYHHRRATTREQLARRLRGWRYRKGYPLLLLLTHGDAGSISLSNDDDAISLDDLATMIGPGCEGRIIFLGGCCVAEDKQGLKDLVDSTGVDLALGFDGNVREAQLGAFVLLLVCAFLASGNK